ncbi:MAG: mucoidy inhibitor MuiA family protein [Bacteroidetes bacterium]|nr:MAG: mucoidy inhibitor MuiA family protein [Bacteroidota bacterium]
MRSISFILFFCVSLFTIGQKPQNQTITSPIKRVKLFLTSGEIEHEQKVQIHKGRNKLIFPGISAFADPQSIQFKGDGNFRLVSVSTEMDFFAAEQFNPRIAILKDSLESLKDRNQSNNDQLSAYQAELELLNANKKLGGQNQNLTVAQIKEAADFYRTRTLEINTKMSKIRKDQIRVNELIETTRYQLVELNYNENQRSNQVIVLLDADESVTFNSTLKYLVSDCGWAALYDLSAKDINSKVNLKYKAQVYNNTGNNWENIDLTLSTGDPRLSASHPVLSPWFLNYYNSKSYSKKAYYAPQVIQQDYRMEAENNLSAANQRVYDNYILDKDKTSEKLEMFKNEIISRQTTNGVAMRQIEISELTAEYQIKDKFNCPSDSKPYMVDVKEMDLEASFSHITVPKLDNAAFLLANIVGWQELELILGPTKVYFGGAYVGMSEIDTRNISDTLSLSFGRDSKVTVMRKLKKEMSTKKVIGGSKKDSYLYEIAVRNNRDVPVTIDIFDQVPISKNSEITVTIDELSGVTSDPETGEVNWKYTLQPGETKSYMIGYTVKYPKEANISMVSFRTVSCPSF